MCQRDHRKSDEASGQMELLTIFRAYFLIIRPKNLFIVAVSQWILYYFIIVPLLSTPALNSHLFSLLVLDTVLIAAGGYIINDILDFKADMTNKPSKTYIPYPIALTKANIYYMFILVSGFFLALYIALKIGNLPLVLIYPIACGLMYLYSSKWKGSVLTGNIIVSLFVALVPGILFFAERNTVMYEKDLTNKHSVIVIFIAYMVFSFLVNMVREIVKDIEDIEGDKMAGHLTFPIKYGVQKAKNIAILLTGITISILFLWILITDVKIDFRTAVFLLLLVAGPLIIIIQILTKTTQKRDITKVSSILKWIMVAGLASIVMISTNF